MYDVLEVDIRCNTPFLVAAFLVLACVPVRVTEYECANVRMCECCECTKHRSTDILRSKMRACHRAWSDLEQDAKCKMQNAKCKMQNAKCKMQNAKSQPFNPVLCRYSSRMILGDGGVGSSGGECERHAIHITNRARREERGMKMRMRKWNGDFHKKGEACSVRFMFNFFYFILNFFFFFFFFFIVVFYGFFGLAKILVFKS